MPNTNDQPARTHEPSKDPTPGGDAPTLAELAEDEGGTLDSDKLDEPPFTPDQED